MKYEVENGWVQYDEDNGELVIENMKVFVQRQGTGSQLINHVKDVAEKKGLNIGLCAHPQDDTIGFDELCEFYEANGFEQTYCDGSTALYEYII